MNNFKKLILLPILSPLLFILLLPLLNVNNSKKTSIIFLIWQTPKLEITQYMALGASIGFIHSLFNSYLMTSTNLSLRRKVYIDNSSPNSKNNFDNVFIQKEATAPDTTLEYIERDFRDPKPTISAPFKIITRISNSDNDSNLENLDIPYTDFFDLVLTIYPPLIKSLR